MYYKYVNGFENDDIVDFDVVEEDDNTFDSIY